MSQQLINTRPIGILLPDRSFYYLNFQIKLEKLLALDKQVIIIKYAENSEKEELNCIQEFSELNISSLFLVCTLNEENKLEQIIHQFNNFELILINPKFADTNFHCISIDWQQSTRLLCEHLASCISKPRKIALFLFDVNYPINNLLLAGYKEALRSIGLKFDRRLVFFMNNPNLEQGIGSLELAMKSSFKPDAFLCQDTKTVDWLSSFLNSLDVQIPEDCPVCSIFEFEHPNFNEREITTIDSKTSQIADLAYEIFKTENLKMEKPIQLRLENQLIVKASSFQRNYKRPKECKF